MDIIKELWYGNVAPFEQCTRGDKQLKELLKLMARNKEELDGTLTEKQKEIFKKFEENMNEMHGIAERDAFSYGFRLGVQLTKDTQLWLGHSDIGTTGNIYSHLDSHSKVQTGAAIYDALTD